MRKSNIRKSAFDLTHEKQLTAKPHGQLYPILCEAVLPSDKFRVNTEILARAVPLINPVYQRFDIVTHYFYIPNRLVWKNWEDFISPELEGQPIPTFPSVKVGKIQNLTPGQPPVYSTDIFNSSNFLSYISGAMSNDGLSVEELDCSFLPIRALIKVWNEYYRDIDLQDKMTEFDGDGVTYDEASLADGWLRVSGGFLNRNWEKDYFTSARPEAQKGQPVNVQVQGTAYIQEQINPLTDNPALIDVNHAYPSLGSLSGGGTNGIQKTTGNQRLWIQPNGTLYADMETAGKFATDESPNVSIEGLRWANTMQKYLEKLSRRGSKYHETLKSLFGSVVPDYRMQRPEFLGGGRQPLVISEVLQTSQSEATPLGTYGGHGISSGRAGFNFTFPEHGYVIGLMSIMPRAKYSNGMRRELLKTDRFDFAIPDFANLGEQQIYEVELNGRLNGHALAEFGYQERYAEYKFIPSTIHGAFRTDNILKNFHCSREQNNYQLNSNFLSLGLDSATIDRIFAIDDYDPFLISLINHVSAIRPLPRHSNPSLTL